MASEENFAKTSKREKKKLKTVTKQDGTHRIPKHTKKTVEEMFQHYQDLIKQIETVDEAEKIFLFEIPPISDSDEISGRSEKIDVFNHTLIQHYEHMSSTKSLH